MVKKGPENAQLKELILLLERSAVKNKAEIWRKAAFLLGKPTRQRVEVNLGNLDRNTKQGEVVIVPGKVLSLGKISHAITLAAWNLSKGAAAKLEKAGCKVITIKELVAKNPQGTKVVFIV